MGVTAVVCFVLLVVGAIAQEDCQKACDSKFTQQTENDGCKEGCRLAVVFAFASSTDSIDGIHGKCRDGCDKSFNKTEVHRQSRVVPASEARDACSFGCDHQPLPNREHIEISFSDNDATFDVAREAMMGRMRLVGFPELADPFFNRMEPADSNEVRDPFAAMRRAMQRGRERLYQMMHNLHSDESDEVAVRRPSGHSLTAMQGPEVDNNDSDGSPIISVSPVRQTQIHVFVPASGEHFRSVRYQFPEETKSFVDRLSQRARRMSILSQWLICIALLLCLLSMLGITFAIVRQIRRQRHMRVRQSHVVIPATFSQQLSAKKVPLESPAAAMDYPLIHDTPPPAYDQLSVHNEKVQEPQQS